MIPGVGPIASFLTDGIVEGAFKAFLTLRVGCIASRYCEAIVRTERKLIRRSATVEAVGMLHGIVLNGVGAISKAVVQAAGESFREKASAIGRAIASAAENAAEAIASTVKKGISPGHGEDRVPDAT